ncbi:MAG: translation initiation factor IF-5A [Candidatus Iainarchaeum archaeon]|mgnify:CR=1 FL=1|uniref:Translation initiation factor 5A n=1 Tax=Candidatus Iainarchaeum sp. TaxID=3101447 RepID=A0A497JI37_9ARCH|nr:MAG: translation initiation factor IF-5A [Candidatus Diapherotrites archaeon]
MEEKKFAKAGSLKPGNYVLIDGRVCQVKEVEKSKPGKHGSAKARITAIDVFTGQKKTLLKPTSADVEVPIIKKSSAQVVAIVGDNLQLMDIESYEMFECKKPSEIEVSQGDEVEYIKYGNFVKITRRKKSE